MKNLIKISLFTAFVLFAFSCRKKLDIEIPETRKHIVINGIISPDSIIKVKVTKSKSVLDDNPVENLSSARVKLFENDVFKENLTYHDSGFFYSSIEPQENSTYKISAEYDNLTAAEALTHLFYPVEVQSIDTLMRERITDWGDGYIDTTWQIQFDIKIRDDENENNFYFLGISSYKPFFDFNDTAVVFSGYYESSYYYYSNEPFFQKENISYVIGNTEGNVFNDEIFNGKEYVITVTADLYKDYYYKSNNAEYPDYMIVKLYTVTEDFYNYVISYNLNQNSRYDPFAQPVQVYSNVKNGLGIFCGYTLYADTLLLNY